MVRVKFCGMTNAKDALAAVKLGVSAVGFIFYKKSPRAIGGFKAKKIIEQLPPFVSPVGVFVNHKEGAIKDIAEFCGIKTIQLHGDETPAFCKRMRKLYKVIKVIRVKEGLDFEALKAYEVDAFLFDTHSEEAYGGTGKSFDWKMIRPAKSLNIPIVLSGGMHYNNVAAAIEEVQPYAVDACSGVEEKPGVKNERSMEEFMKAVSL